MPSTSKPPKDVLRLIERFDNNIDAYRSGRYNETQVRIEFIDPFFKALGWDINNEQGYAEAYKDVIHEEAIKIGAATKAPDYCFRIGGTRKFFLEAKKPSVNLKADINPAFQLRRYAWSAKLPLSVLTDFEEFAVYDCRLKPVKNDSAATARVKYLTYQEYEQRWEEIESAFSRDAVLKGSFDKFAETSKLKKGTAAVDDIFLKEIEQWRSELAHNIALRNPRLSQRELNFSIQRTIDRIIFLRICEDRGIELYGRLMALQNGDNVYRRLCDLFHRADERYNSGLFHFSKERDREEPPDELTLQLAIDDKPLKEILKSLYYPESPYEFSVLPADILGQVYEQFLGKVIRLTAGHRAVIEDKPEVKKAGGVYYTPTYIVDYIVKNTVGKLLGAVIAGSPDVIIGTTKSRLLDSALMEGFSKAEQSHSLENEIASPRKSGVRNDKGERGEGLTPKQASKLHILDPACGSGSFLIGAYQYLLDWHRDWYVNDGAEKYATGKKAVIYQSSGGDWRLTTAERKRILLNNIYGVDIDPQAVEVTKLSLLLKVLEGENDQTITSQLNLIHERALPDLSSNIKCGNSLIGPDFYSSQLSLRGNLLLDDEERMRINAFDWKKEFAEVFSAAGPVRRSPGVASRDVGGFDAVIGNPPYIRIQGFPRNQVDYFVSHYQSATSNYDLYVIFVEKTYNLLGEKGRFGMIVPNKFFKTDYGLGLREFLTTNKCLSQIVDFGANQVFDATTYTCLLLLENHRNDIFFYSEAQPTGEALTSLRLRAKKGKTLDKTPWSFESDDANLLIKKLSQGSKRLLDLPADMSRGSSSGDDEVFMLSNKAINVEKEILRIPVFATDFNRYTFSPSGEWRIIFPYERKDGKYVLYAEEELKSDFPKAYRYLQENQSKLKKRKQFKEWFGFSAPRNLELHEEAQIVIPLLANHGIFGLIPDESRGKLCPMASGGFTITISRECRLRPEYVLALLNSRLLFWKLERTSNVFRGGWITCTKQYFGELPIRTINFSDPADKSRHDKMVAFVERMLELHKQLAAAKTEHEKTALQRQIETTDNQIDQLVYELYGITDDEQKIIEGANV
jgi:type I restriction-modification system DNA methylase subunit